MKPIKNKVRMKCCYYILSHNHSSILRILLSSKSTKGETTWEKHIYTLFGSSLQWIPDLDPFLFDNTDII